jgi:tetratricopeptide (TPR) repeat protein
MRVAMPTGNTHGWGIAGTYLYAGIAKLSPIAGMTLHSVAGHHFAPTFAEQWDRINIGYCFFESEILAYRYIPEASRRWDYIVAGSSWCEYHLRIAGMDRTSTVLQGIDPALFSPKPARADDGRFIVFSGGKFEFRKGHDIVIAAMRKFMQSHPDAWLACSWHNHWPMSIRTMEQSRLINFSYRDLPSEELYLRLLAENGIPVDRVIMYPVLDNRLMCQAYAASDVGIFPNRCEGGNNMVMCEYMASGRPVIASTMTGHMDVINAGNALCLTHYEPVLATHEGAPMGVWFEPSVDEALSLLEQAYNDRRRLEQLAMAAGSSMAGLSWNEAAKKFHDIGQKLAGSKPNSSFDSSSAVVTTEHAAKLFNAGQYVEAEQVFSRLLAMAPLDPELHNNLGTVLDRLERYAESTLHYEKALSLRPGFIAARFNLANTLQRMGDNRGAVEQLEAVVSSAPDFVEAWQNLALCRLDGNDPNGTAEALQRVLQLDPACDKSRADLGEVLIELGRYNDALSCFDLVLEHDPDNPGVLNSKGIALQWLNQLDAAESCYRRILADDPDNSLALNNLGAIMRSRGLPGKAIVFFNRALEIAPDDDKIRFNLALAYLLTGNFQKGWPYYESRFRCETKNQLRHVDLPRWQGENLQGRSILVWCEQGYGDSIQFIRYAALLAEAGATVLVEAQDERIAPLLGRAKGVSRVLRRGEETIRADFQIPLLSLPGLLGNIPCPPYYLSIGNDEVSSWRELLGADNKLKIGIAWAGRPAHENDRNRSIPAEFFKPLEEFTDAVFVSLQFSPADKILKPELVDLGSMVKNFNDSAALVTGLDLVITVDSAVAHLAGALGVPVWILLPYNPDWRWLMGLDETTWYGTARLFRQERPFEWGEVIEKIVHELKIFQKQKK